MQIPEFRVKATGDWWIGSSQHNETLLSPSHSPNPRPRLKNGSAAEIDLWRLNVTSWPLSQAVFTASDSFAPDAPAGNLGNKHPAKHIHAMTTISRQLIDAPDG
ncbi:MAG TPA: hypothetical protein DDZ51_03495 [Planctomycetaceae bacterium]|nr:hypothetical protein [Planctomycetaceae bacterium]